LWCVQGEYDFGPMIFYILGLDSDLFFRLALQNEKQIFFNWIPHMTKYFVMRECEDSYREYLCCDSAFAHKEEFYIFKFPESFLEISCAEISLFSTSLFLTL
jgi:hypothetical protein